MAFGPELLDRLTVDLPEELHGVAAEWLARFDESHDLARLTPEHIKLAAVSEFAGKTMIRQWDTVADFLSLPTREALAAFVSRIGESDAPDVEVKRELREYRNAYLVAVIAQDMRHPERFAATLDAWSTFASGMLEAASRYAARCVEKRFGRIRNRAGKPVFPVIIGMGKLGGYELNWSSDIDIVFLYSEYGESDGPRSVSAETWFTRYSQQIVSLIDEKTADGFVFRVDTRLRPFGDSGPPVTSFAALETYLLNQGRAWERYAYVKARAVGPAVPADVHAELFDRLIRPFVYRRYLDYGIFESLREMHGMISAEVQRRELRDNLKLGPGGIREIEFLVQSLQLLRGGSRQELARPELLAVLSALADGKALSAADSSALRNAYVLLRRAENFVQAIRDRQVHDLPRDPVDRARLACALGKSGWTALQHEIDTVRRDVSQRFRSVAFGARDDARQDTPATALWREDASPEDWCRVLDIQASEAAELVQRLDVFREDPRTCKADAIARRRLDDLMPTLLLHVASSRAPVTTLERVLGVVSGVIRRSAYLALLLENPAAAGRLVELCSRSGYLAAELKRYPVLLDELLDTRVHGEGLSRQELGAALRERLEQVGSDDPEAAVDAIAQFQRATLFRIAVADFNDRLPLMKVSDALTFLAEAVLDAALSIAWRDLVRRHGEPTCVVDDEPLVAGFGIVAYGKLGGLELSYGSDLDIVFIHNSTGNQQQTNGEKPLDNAVFFMRLARRLIHYLTTQTRSGVLYEIDTRLRPSGRKGLLVTSLDAFARYQADDAWTWEHQALLRARAVAGSPEVGRRFDEIRAQTLTIGIDRTSLRQNVIQMRQKMRDELDRSTAELFDLKHGTGGLGDIEFLVQYLVLANCHEFPELIEFSDNIRQLDALREARILEPDDALRLQDIYREYRQRQHRRALDDAPPLVPSTDYAAEAAEVLALWQRFLAADES